MTTPAIAISDPTTDKPPRRRRRFPVSVRIFGTLLVLLGVAAGWRCAKGYRQLLTIREVERLGGTALSTPVGPTWLRRLAGEERMRMFDDVTEVWLNRSEASDETLRQLGGLNGLTELRLAKTNVTDDGLTHLRGLFNLRKLVLDDTPITDLGLPCLKELANLESLWLDNTQVTDAGLAHLQDLKKLKMLWMDNTSATDGGVIELRHNMPGLVIYYRKSLL